MYFFEKKQKIILGILIVIVAGCVCYYVYAKDDENITQVNLESNIETEEQIEEKEQESYSDDIIVVHVSGAVNKEGIIELKVGSRIADAIDKAGGVREDANIEDINLAYLLEDGMKIHVLTKQEKENNITEKEYITTSSGLSDNNENKENKNNTKQSKINLNTATQTQLETLPGVGPSTATKIIAYRKEKGNFNKIEELKEISGIGDAKFEKMKEFISVK